jgi:hypothetical protein
MHPFFDIPERNPETPHAYPGHRCPRSGARGHGFQRGTGPVTADPGPPIEERLARIEAKAAFISRDDLSFACRLVMPLSAYGDAKVRSLIKTYSHGSEDIADRHPGYHLAFILELRQVLSAATG